YAGGYDMIESCILKGWDELDRDKLVEYAVKMGTNSLVSRLGFLVERNGLDIRDDLVRKLLDHKSKAYIQIFEGKEKNKRWRVKY
ncbi:MAG: hypothetical protein ACOC6H_03245, partial [Thermoproteota archaeon]